MAKYKLEKGKHYNQSKVRFIISLVLGLANGEAIRRWFLIHLSKQMVRWVYFPSNAWYPKSVLQKDKNGNYLTGWNKLFGFSGWLIHLFSGRLVWEPDFERPGYIKIALYVYNEGLRDVILISSIKTSTLTEMSVQAIYDGYYGWVDNDFRFIEAEKTPHFIVAEPYFGGHSVAPWDITIYLYNPLTYKLFKKWIHKRHGL
jgi:hypothetical protein